MELAASDDSPLSGWGDYYDGASNGLDCEVIDDQNGEGWEDPACALHEESECPKRITKARGRKLRTSHYMNIGTTLSSQSPHANEPAVEQRTVDAVRQKLRRTYH